MTAALVLCGCMGAMTPAQAHLVAAQKGTLNFAGNAAFLVLSVPVSAMHSVDDDGDGILDTEDKMPHDFNNDGIQDGRDRHEGRRDNLEKMMKDFKMRGDNRGPGSNNSGSNDSNDDN